MDMMSLIRRMAEESGWTVIEDEMCPAHKVFSENLNFLRGVVNMGSNLRTDNSRGEKNIG